MAAATPVTSLEEEVSCPICQGVLREPVTIDCGHNFCRGCLTRYCETPGPASGAPACPLCKEPFRAGGFRPNWQLASVVANIERLKSGSRPGAGGACPEHGEKLYFFCEEDEAQLCALCREAAEHRAHAVRFLEEAAGPYRVGAAAPPGGSGLAQGVGAELGSLGPLWSPLCLPTSASAGTGASAVRAGGEGARRGAGSGAGRGLTHGRGRGAGERQAERCVCSGNEGLTNGVACLPVCVYTVCAVWASSNRLSVHVCE